MTTRNTDCGTGADLIAAERKRQVEAEGWTPEHDDEHVDEEMVWAASCYLLNGRLLLDDQDVHERFWPWDQLDWNPAGDRVRNLTKAGALIAAEIDRLQRVDRARR